MSIFEYNEEEELKKLRASEFEYGKQEGIKEGIKEGVKEGCYTERRLLLIQILKTKGTIDNELISIINDISYKEQLKDWIGIALESNNLECFRNNIDL